MLVELTRAVETAHPWTHGHASRVSSLSASVASALGWERAEMETLRLGSLLHDVGKLALPVELLGRPGPLTVDELEVVRTHPAAGARILRPLAGATPALPVVLHHHERWDGTGYPRRLAGPRIPVEARLVALADAFDAMTTTRPYRPALPYDAALAELARCAGTQFDPILAHACVEIWSARVEAAAG
jgi:putative nucleotidyltransferase with HDIG domain